jgi:hypothetical protein
VIALNASSATRTIDVPLGPIGLASGALTDVRNGGPIWPFADGQLRDLKLAPRSGGVLKVAA